MTFKIREFYYYAICFVTLIICIFSFTGLVNSIIDLVIPYPLYTPSRLDTLRMYEKTESQLMDQKTLEKWIEEERKIQENRERRNRLHQLVNNLGRSITLLVISVPLYLYHWRRVRKFE